MKKIYFQKEASQSLSSIIKSFWLVDDDHHVRKIEKIIPDGYPELIFHYGDFYKANISRTWQLQAKNLIAGQIKNHFFLENTGIRKVFGIKLQPWALNELFGVNMQLLTNKVIELPQEIEQKLTPIIDVSKGPLFFDEKVKKIEYHIEEILSKKTLHSDSGQKSVKLIIEHRGKLDLKSIRNRAGISERSLERYFRTHIGLSPKYYSRIIRFSHIFRLVSSNQIDWTDIFYITGFYDQSHFIKNFKEFTGEDPSKYSFFEENLANLFLKQ